MSTENMPKKGSNTGWYIGAVVIIVIIVIAGVLAYQYLGPSSTPSPSPSTSQTPTPTGSSNTMTIYGGEISSSQYGFGMSSSGLTSPGPTLTFKVGQSYTVTFTNSGTMIHGWEITTDKAAGTAVFGAGIGVSNYLSPGQSGSVTFTPNQAGNYYYVCPVPGHAALGMWGNVVVNP